jgi:hypothetical protein
MSTKSSSWVTPGEGSPDERFREKLARSRSRGEAQRDRIRALLQAEPDLLELADVLKETFQAKLTYLRIGDETHGTPLPEGVCPVAYNPPKVKKWTDTESRSPTRKGPNSLLPLSKNG